MEVRGIDVSKHNGTIDFDKVKKAGAYDFVIIRAGFGRVITQKDSKFEENYTKAKAAGLNVGAYWYSYAMSPEEAEQEALIFLEVIKGKQFEYPVFLDLEEQKQFRLGKIVVSNMVDRFCKTLEANGYYVGLYMSRAQLTTYVEPAVRNRYCVWCAEWGAQCNYDGAYGLWQYSEKGSVPGITGPVDLDKAYADFPTIIKGKNLNGFKQVISAPKPKTVYNVVVGEYDDKDVALNVLKNVKEFYPKAKVKATTTVK